MNLEEWACAVQIAGSKRNRSDIKNIIKAECLLSAKKVHGAYQIDGRKVWEVLIQADASCHKVIREKNIKDHMDLESIIEQKKYHAFWSNNRRAYGKKRR